MERCPGVTGICSTKRQVGSIDTNMQRTALDNVAINTVHIRS